ncbi:unannotated protein [freshwater metagenome]|uniref:Unannotated protein n=1 Tax=freshwater metagenome TaxID=449393 RepID=A0A6J7KCP1_9ZZZZ
MHTRCQRLGLHHRHLEVGHLVHTAADQVNAEQVVAEGEADAVEYDVVANGGSGSEVIVVNHGVTARADEVSDTGGGDVVARCHAGERHGARVEHTVDERGHHERGPHVRGHGIEHEVSHCHSADRTDCGARERVVAHNHWCRTIVATIPRERPHILHIGAGPIGVVGVADISPIDSHPRLGHRQNRADRRAGQREGEVAWSLGEGRPCGHDPRRHSDGGGVAD